MDSQIEKFFSTGQTSENLFDKMIPYLLGEMRKLAEQPFTLGMTNYYLENIKDFPFIRQVGSNSYLVDVDKIEWKTLQIHCGTVYIFTEEKNMHFVHPDSLNREPYSRKLFCWLIRHPQRYSSYSDFCSCTNIVESSTAETFKLEKDELGNYNVIDTGSLTKSVRI